MDERKVPTKAWVQIKVSGSWVTINDGEDATTARSVELFEELTAAEIPARVRSQSLVTETTLINTYAT